MWPHQSQVNNYVCALWVKWSVFPIRVSKVSKVHEAGQLKHLEGQLKHLERMVDSHKRQLKHLENDVDAHPQSNLFPNNFVLCIGIFFSTILLFALLEILGFKMVLKIDVIPWFHRKANKPPNLCLENLSFALLEILGVKMVLKIGSLFDSFYNTLISNLWQKFCHLPSLKCLVLNWFLKCLVLNWFSKLMYLLGRGLLSAETDSWLISRSWSVHARFLWTVDSVEGLLKINNIESLEAIGRCGYFHLERLEKQKPYYYKAEAVE